MRASYGSIASLPTSRWTGFTENGRPSCDATTGIRQRAHRERRPRSSRDSANARERPGSPLALLRIRSDSQFRDGANGENPSRRERCERVGEWLRTRSQSPPSQYPLRGRFAFCPADAPAATGSADGFSPMRQTVAPRPSASARSRRSCARCIHAHPRSESKTSPEPRHAVRPSAARHVFVAMSASSSCTSRRSAHTPAAAAPPPQWHPRPVRVPLVERSGVLVRRRCSKRVLLPNRELVRARRTAPLAGPRLRPRWQCRYTPYSAGD